jgi:hypothetical protein
MSSRLLSKGSGPDFGESRHRSAADTEALLHARIKGAIQGIGNNLDRLQVVMDRMERKLAEATR